MTSTLAPSDALVFFGATGDLAYKKIFPALQSMARRGTLTFPVIGVAKSGWTTEQLVERARASVTAYGGLKEDAFKILASKLRYVDGDYGDIAPFKELKALLDKEETVADLLQRLDASLGKALAENTAVDEVLPEIKRRRGK